MERLRIAFFSWLAIGTFASSGFAQETTRVILRDAPRHHGIPVDEILATGAGLPVWHGTITNGSTVHHYVMVGSDPAKGSQTTKVPAFIIPLKLTFADGKVFDASAPMIGETISATQAISESPILQSAPFTAGSVNVGTTQYVDAFQRANFWSSVSTTSPNYHVLLTGPVVLPTQSYKVPAGQGSVMPGPVAGTFRATLDQSFIDSSITPALFKKFPHITPADFTIFLTYNVFPGGAYGYHDYYGPNAQTGKTYTFVSYLEPYKQLIDADISTLAHEVAEWMDDPYGSNNTKCGILEVADPLSDVIFEVNLNGVVWHPQDLAMIGYFYQKPIPSVNGWLTFRNTYSKPCANGS
jgi:hypothetical protein